MPSKIIKAVCPLCSQKFNRQEGSVKIAIRTTGYWACKTCTLIKKNKENASPVGEKRIVAKGYVEIKTETGWIREHRHIMSQYIGRELKGGEIVHHDNTHKADNEPENLMLMTHGEHTSLHNIGREVSVATREKISKSKQILSLIEQEEVRRKHKACECGYDQLAVEYCVSKSTIVRIVKRMYIEKGGSNVKRSSFNRKRR